MTARTAQVLLPPVSAFENATDVLEAVGRPLSNTNFYLTREQVNAFANANPGGRPGQPGVSGTCAGLFARLLAEVMEVPGMQASYGGCKRASFPETTDEYTRIAASGQLLAAREAEAGVLECVVRLVLETEAERRLVCVADAVMRLAPPVRAMRSSRPRRQVRGARPAGRSLRLVDGGNRQGL